MVNYIDLQCHTTASDGRNSPQELIDIAVKKKLSAISITDHDTINGLYEALKYAKNKNIEIIPGVEITCDDRGFMDTHILGLFIDYKNNSLISLLNKSKKFRDIQKKDTIIKLRDLGFSITYKEVRAMANGEIGRPHIAKVLLKNNPDKVESIEDIFSRYLATGEKAYVKRKKGISVKEAIAAIHSAKGLAFVAHPGVYNHFDADKFVRYFLKNGGDGIETIYDYSSSRKSILKKESREMIKKYRNLAKKLKILETGGSDFHGKKFQVLGKLKVPVSILSNLKAAISERG